MLNKKITIILLIKGRPGFTERWLNYVNDNFKGINVIIADGSMEKERYVVSKYHFPNINILVPNFPYDKDISIYQNKILDSINLVKTDYLCMMSNDDFIFKDSFESIVKFLENNHDYSAGRGDVLDFNVNSITSNKNIYGNIYGLHKLYRSIGFEQNDVTERLKEFKRCPNGLWHCIVRKSIFKEVMQKVILDKVISHQIFENLITFYFLISGKIYFNASLYLLHQVHPEMQTTGNNFKSFKTEINKDKTSYKKFIDILLKLFLTKKILDPTKAKFFLVDIFKNLERKKIDVNLLNKFSRNANIIITKVLRYNPYILYILINIKTKLMPYKKKYKVEINKINNFLKRI